MTESLGMALTALFSLGGMTALLIGVAIGILSGILPGLGITGLLTVLGVAYAFDPMIAIPLAVGSLVPVATMDAVPAVLLGVPGSSSSQALIMEGYPLARKGRATEALAANYGASLVGGLAGTALLIATVPTARRVLSYLGSPEFFVVGLIGVGLLAIISRGSMIKGLLAGVAGLLLGSIGIDIAYGVTRLDFGIAYLFNGIHVIPFVLGLFAWPELALLVLRDKPIANAVELGGERAEARRQTVAGLLAVVKHRYLVLRSVIVGTIVGMMPGVGGSVVDWLVYAHARAGASGKDDDEFGRGDIRGVVAPGAADNALVAASFIPTIGLGIPGSVSMAVFIGFLILIGVQPGPEMLEANLHLTYLIILCVGLGNVFSATAGLLLSRYFGKLTRVPASVLVPCVAGFLVVLSFQGRGTMGDLIVVFIVGMLGLLMRIYGWARPPLLIGFVLAPIIERYGRLMVRAYGVTIFARPQLWIIVGTVAIFAIYVRVHARNTEAASLTTATPSGDVDS